jgi:drug/metabolite transporter (DMT)-like permease
MLWSVYAIIGAFFDATYYASLKRLVKDIDQHVLASGVFLSASAVLLLIALFNGLPAIGPGFYSAVLATAILNVASAALYFRALKLTDLSLAMPMVAFTPVFLIFTSLILLDEFPTPYGIVGIFLIVLGSYVLNTGRNDAGLLDPFKEIIRNRGVLLMLFVAFLYSISSNFDKMVVLNSDPVFGSSMVFLLLGISFLLISIATKREIAKVYKKNLHKFIVVGLIIAFVVIPVNIALSMQIVPYVISLKRLNILFSVLYGGLLFKEKDVAKRLFGAFLMVAGTLVIIL